MPLFFLSSAVTSSATLHHAQKRTSDAVALSPHRHLPLRGGPPVVVVHDAL